MLDGMGAQRRDVLTSAFEAGSPYFYSRKDNPNVAEFEAALKTLADCRHAIAVATGMTDQNVPVGVQLVGGRYREDTLLAAGDVIAAASGFVSSFVHATAAGTVKSIEHWPHPAGAMQPSVRIEVDPHSTQLQRPRLVPHWDQVPEEQLSEEISKAGIVGLGGAAFPSHVKLRPPEDQPVDVLMVNGCECEPYLTTDHRLMLERPEALLEGAEIMRQKLGAGPVYISFDIDAIDPAYAPGTGTPVCGGLSTHQALEIVRGLKGINLVGMDLVEVALAAQDARALVVDVEEGLQVTEFVGSADFVNARIRQFHAVAFS